MTTTTAPPARALSIDAALAARVHRGAICAAVHSSFPRVVNLVSADGSLTSLCARSLDDAPGSVRADVPAWPAERWAPGRAVLVAPDGVTLSGDRARALTFDRPTRWRATRAPLPADPAALAARVALLDALVAARGVPGGALPASAPETTPGRRASIDPFAAAVAARVRDGVDAIERGERAGDRATVARAVAALLGLGPGLTPTGDDVLTGILLVAAQPGSRIRFVPEALAAELAARPDATTVVSRTTLLEALRGRARQRLMILLERLAEPFPGDRSSDARLRRAAADVLGIGHTSGTDILSGIVTGLRLERERRGRA